MVQRSPSAARIKTTDDIVGGRIRETRLALGMKQLTLAEKIGVSYQQLQKYEKGQSRLTIGQLWTVATALGVPVSDLIADIDFAESDREYVHSSREALELFNRLPASRRRAVLTLMRQDENLDETA